MSGYGSGESVGTWRGQTTVKCLRSNVATSDGPSRCAMATTAASVVPSGRWLY
jgi:hypothetical protein